MVCLWPGLGHVLGSYMAGLRAVVWIVLWALHIPQWVLKVKDVITFLCNSMLGYCCLIEC